VPFSLLLPSLLNADSLLLGICSVKKKKIDPMEICKETSADTSADSMKRQKL
jgi:hypothetical protein